MLNFLQRALITGFAVLVPLALFALAITELFDLMVNLATPIAEFFPEDWFPGDWSVELLAGLLILGVALFIGVVARIPFVRSAGRALESATLGKFPPYRMLSTMVGALLGTKDTNSFKPALLRVDDRIAEPAYLIEDRGGPLVVVFVPWSPASFSGQMKVVNREAVHLLDMTLDDYSLSVSNYGLDLLDKLQEQIDWDETQS